MGNFSRPKRKERGMCSVSSTYGASADSNALRLQIRFLGDPTAKFTEALDLVFDSSSIFGNERSKRYALVIEDGKVKEAFVEPDNTGVNGTQFSTIIY
jgi:peroxiredoxin 5